MIWLLALLVAMAVLGCLGVLSEQNLPNVDTLFALGEMGLFVGLSIFLVGCAFLLQKFYQLSQKSVGKTRLFAVLLTGLMLCVAVGLFVGRTISVYQNLQHAVPQYPYTVSATVTVSEISDSVYGKREQTYYRQKAILTDLAWVDNTNKYADNVAVTHNPFSNDDSSKRPPLPSEMTVMLSAFAGDKKDFSQLSNLTPNSQVKMTLQVSPISRQVSATGFDGYRYLTARHIHANAKILAIDGQITSATGSGLSLALQHLRQGLREHFYKNWHDLPQDKRQAKAITLSLLTGDRALTDSKTKELYQFAGISHLLAISGTHVVFLALMLASMMTALTDKIYPRAYVWLPRQSLRLWIMAGAGLLYALFTGFDVPAVRTVYMLVAVIVARQLALPLSSGKLLALVAVVMIWLDPFVVWQAGFWLSFVAVALLMSHGQDEFSQSRQSFKQQALSLLKLQSYLFVAMLPISIFLFGKVSLWGLVVNLGAIGLFSAVIVPLNLLAGVLFAIVPPVADLLWSVVGGVLWVFHELLYGLQDAFGNSWIYDSFGGVGLLFMGLIVLVYKTPLLSKIWVILPSSTFMLTLFAMPSESPLTLVVLPSDDNALSQVLIYQKDGDPDSVDGRAVWLVVSDFGTRKTPDSLAKLWTDQLKKHGINHLTGVVVQTPSQNAYQALIQVQKSIPIYRLWQPDEQMGTLPALACAAGQTWQGSHFSMKILTGWQQFGDETVRGCTVMFDSQYTPLIVGGLTSSDDKTNNHPDTKQIILNGATHERTWQLYEMICQNPNVNIAPSAGVLWLSHSSHAVSTDTLSQFAPKQVVFSDTPNRQNQQKITEQLAQWRAYDE